MNAKEAAWALHLENVELREEVIRLRAELKSARRSAGYWRKQALAAAPTIKRLRHEVFAKQVSRLVRS